MNQALLRMLTACAPPADVTAELNAFIREQLDRTGYFHVAFPPLPAGAPWWEVGWEARYVVRQHLSTLGRRDLIARRAMTRAQWRAWWRDYRPGQVDQQDGRDAQFAESYHQMGRVVALIRGVAAHKEG